MKYMPKIVLLLSVLAASCAFCANGAAQIKKTMKIQISTAFPPQARTTGTVGANVTNTRSPWLQADIKFRTQNQNAAAMRFLDKPQLEIQIATYVRRRSAGSEKVIVFNGKIDYLTLELDGREHYLKALLPAVLFRRYAYDRSLQRTEFVAKASYSVNGKVIATAYGSNRGLSEKDIMNYFRMIPKNAVIAADTVYGRQGTSWSIIDVNKYEMEKIR